MKRLILLAAILMPLAGTAAAQPTDTTPSTSQPSRNGDVTAPPASPGTGNGPSDVTRGSNPPGPAQETVPQQSSGGATTILWPATGVFLLVVGGILIFYSLRRQRLDPRTQQAHDEATREVFKQEGEGPTGRPGRS